MEYAGALWRFLCCATQALIQNLSPPIAVVSARHLESQEDLTADVIARLAVMEGGLADRLDPDIVIEYTLNGTGPYALLSQNWPPPPEAPAEMTPLDRQLVMATGEDGEDVTDEAKKWLGPGGLDEIPASVGKRWGGKVTIYYADGNERVLSF